MSTTPWEDMGQRWRELYDQQAQMARDWAGNGAKLAETFTGSSTVEGAAADAAAVAELWRSWMALGGSFARAAPGLADPGKIAGDTLGHLLNPLSLALVGGSQVGDTIRRLTEGPRFADFGAVERRIAKAMEVWLEMQKASRAYEMVVTGAWGEASKRFAQKYQDLYQAGDAPTEPRAALKLWLDIANRTLLETHRSGEFLDAQGEFLRRSMDFLLAERELVEAFVEPAGLPTRSEIDELHRSVHELKREVRALRQAAARPAPAAPAPRPAAKPRRKAPAQAGKGAAR